MRPTSILALLLLASLLAGWALGAPEDDFRRTVPAGEFLAKIERGAPIDALWKNGVFDLRGVGDVYRRTFSVVVTSTPEERRGWLAEVREIVGTRFPA